MNLDVLSSHRMAFIFLERKMKRIAKYQQSIDLLKKGTDGLIVSVKQHPLPWILMLTRFMKSGRPFAVFCERQGMEVNFVEFSFLTHMSRNS